MISVEAIQIYISLCTLMYNYLNKNQSFLFNVFCIYMFIRSRRRHTNINPLAFIHLPNYDTAYVNS